MSPILVFGIIAEGARDWRRNVYLSAFVEELMGRCANKFLAIFLERLDKLINLVRISPTISSLSIEQ